MLTEEPPVFAIPEDFVIDEAKLVATRRRLEAAGVEFCWDEGFYPISEAHLQKHLTFI